MAECSITFWSRCESLFLYVPRLQGFRVVRFFFFFFFKFEFELKSGPMSDVHLHVLQPLNDFKIIVLLKVQFRGHNNIFVLYFSLLCYLFFQFS